MGYVYKITNILTGKAYIGETVQADPLAQITARMRESVKRRPLRGCGEILVGSSPTLCTICVAQW
jgi:hypothetical protein